MRAFLEKPLEKPIPIPTEDLAEDQIEAARILSQHRFAVLMGPPGSGKTYLFARYVLGLQAAGYRRIAYCAPTGKAAARMTESLADTVSGAQAYTIHKTLGPQPDMEGGFSFTYGPRNPLPVDAIVVDETSMLDTGLAARLLEATTPNMAILFVGDPYQLPSIGPGSVLRDLASSGVPTSELNEIKRNAGQIVRACHRIKDGKAFQWSENVDLDGGENLRHILKTDAREIIETIVRIASEKVRLMGLDPVWDCQVIAPMNEKSEVSCKALNERLAEALNPGPPIKGLDFRIGDKVVRTKNAVVVGTYGSRFDRKFDGELVRPEDLDPVEITNGDQGRMLAVVRDREKKNYIVVHLRNPDRIVYLPRGEHHLARAYALTCHKMQGSDAPIVVLPLHRSFGRFPTREWIYTALSRAKHLCITVGESQVALDMVRRVSPRRITRLVERIQGKA